MRAISKGQEPPSLTAYRQTLHCTYEGYGSKEELRQALVTEQRGLCCYCMGRISSGATTMKIEHWQCQAHHPDEQLNYRNLLGACLGGQGQPADSQHCDTKKGKNDLQWNPADPTHRIETRVRYDRDGTIHANEALFDQQLNEVLNLNVKRLKNNRKGVYDAVLDWWDRERSRLRGPISRARIERERALRVAGNSELTPYVQVAVWLLDQKLARMGR